MHEIFIRNNYKPLVGKIKINGSKNAVLPIMAASLLCSSPITLFNVPDLVDVQIMINLLQNLGAEVKFTHNKDYKANHTLEIDCSNIRSYSAQHEIANQLRASFLMLGPMLSKFGEAKITLPGGCNIGKRPVDMHVKALEEMGAKIAIDGNNIVATAKGKLQGREITFEKISVGATENIIMAATLAEGATTINNAAIEPEVLDLIDFLKKVGADINVYDDSITIKGVGKLNGCTHKIIPDRIEAGTYALAAIITGGELKLEGISILDIKCILNELEAIGANIQPIAESSAIQVADTEIQEKENIWIPVSRTGMTSNQATDLLLEPQKFIESHNDCIVISRKNGHINSINVATNPYPNFPSDMQPQLMSVMCIADGTSTIEENIFENRFTHINELRKLGANISIEKNKATVIGVKSLFGASLCATDLRSTAALILASLVAGEKTVISNANHLLRGYEAMHEKLNSCGADISVFM
ncbi:UDP-N-acetylglucosamine 1-carboxyvinyltransferase [Wolbachia endosymbiont of Folsomia candida]|uniref:UDP-N-acetylglucosamine 1-carboxyvinyltransferase n=1 Tax=Wolbachia endosymbiont of Folsomia candida TaxID=169402 RepID=UPI000AD32D65|nr:UDP-N-acetylglucosamine 1-carboxyvinyltransferase [Wolbachia endosymbiont of Folsomia candida]APR98094.1 UDP-N-acetylglucosamine 1-carboxyvinyltransferase [Wolbachia endosymbiont of Folsomia candida]